MDRSRRGAPVICLAYPGIEDLVDPAEIRSMAPNADIVVCPYSDSIELRTAKRLDPQGRVVRDLSPALRDDQRRAFARAEIVLALDVPLDLGDIAPELRWIQAVGSGVGQFASAALEAHEIELTSAAGVSAVPIAEFVIGRVLMVWKRFRELEELQQRHDWSPTLGRTLSGATMGIIGLGAIGAELAVRSKALGMQVLATRRRVELGSTLGVDELHGPGGLVEVMSRSDVVTLCAPATSETENMIDSRSIGAMKSGSVLCNVARGNLVDEDALVAALQSGKLSAAIVDVARQEPLPPDSALWHAPNLYVSPHSAAAPDQYFGQLFALFLENIRRYLAGEPLRNVVDLSRGY